MNNTSKNIFSGAIGYILPIALNIFTTPFIIKSLGAEAYGIQSLVNVIIGFLMVADMGLDIPVTKAVAEYKAHKQTSMLNALLNSTLQIYLLIGVIGLLIIGASASILVDRVFKVPMHLHGEAVQVFYLAGIGFVGSLFSMWGKSIFNGLLRYDIANGINLVSNILALAVGTFMVVNGYGVVVYVFVRVGFTFLSGIAYLVIGKRFLTDFKISLRINREVWISLKSQIGYGFLLRIAGILTSRLDSTLIGVFIGVAAVGFYSIPILIITSLGGLINSMTHFLFPQISELNSLNKQAEIKALFFKASRFIGILVFLVYAPFIVFGSQFLNLWVGHLIAEKASDVFMLLLIATIITTLFLLFVNSYLVAIGKLGLFTKYTIFRSIIMGIGFVIFIKHLGLLGVGISMIIAGLFDIGFYFYIVLKFLKVNPAHLFYGIFLKLLITTFCTGMIIKFCYLSHVTNMFSLLVGGSLYLICFILFGLMFKILNHEERTIITSAFKRLAKV